MNSRERVQLALDNIEVLELDAVALRELLEDDPHLAVSIQQHVIQGLLARIVDLRLE